MNIADRLSNRPPVGAPGNFYDEHMPEVRQAMEEVLHPKLESLNDHDVVQALHQINTVIQKRANLAAHVQCHRQECSFCCHSEIFLTKTEVDYIKQHATYEVDKTRQEKQRNTLDYRSLSFADKACIMLKNGKCQIYEHRPLLCRNHVAAIGTDPEECRQQNLEQDGKHFVNEPKAVLTEATNFYLPAYRVKSVTEFKNIADFDW